MRKKFDLVVQNGFLLKPLVSHFLHYQISTFLSDENKKKSIEIVEVIQVLKVFYCKKIKDIFLFYFHSKRKT